MEKISDPTAQTVSASVRRARERRGLSARELSRRLEAAGYPLAQTLISRLERGEREATASDVVALAAVLNVSPLALLLPLGDDGAQDVNVTGAGTVPIHQAWAWAQGYEPLGEPTGDKRTAEWEFRLYSLPPGLRKEPESSI